MADWQKSHRDRQLYFSYFGMADPSYYKIDYVNLPGGFPFVPARPLPPISQPSYVAISATNLQGVYIPANEFAEFRKHKPMAVLGGSIYIYDWPLK